MALDVSKSLFAVCAVNRQIFVLSMKVNRSSTFSLREGSCLFCAVYGSACLLPVFALLKDDMIGDWFVNEVRVRLGLQKAPTDCQLVVM